jgi:biopolymer transport protein ExbD
MAARTNGEAGDFGFQIAPMVDVVFVLLLFFMACAGLNLKEGYLKVPLATGPSPARETLIILDIDAAGTVFVNGSPMGNRSNNSDLAKLRSLLAQAMQSAPEDPIVIRPNMETRHERVVAVVDACHSVHVKKLSFM